VEQGYTRLRNHFKNLLKITIFLHAVLTEDELILEIISCDQGSKKKDPKLDITVEYFSDAMVPRIVNIKPRYLDIDNVLDISVDVK